MSQSPSPMQAEAENKLDVNGDEGTDSSLTIPNDHPSKLEVAEKPAISEPSELTLQSALQVLGGFMLLFNSYFLVKWGITIDGDI
jgi:hypothetical protein